MCTCTCMCVTRLVFEALLDIFIFVTQYSNSKMTFLQNDFVKCLHVYMQSHAIPPLCTKSQKHFGIQEERLLFVLDTKVCWLPLQNG